MTPKAIWYWVWQLTRYERRYGSLQPEWRYTVVAMSTGNQRLFYYLAIQAIQIRMSRRREYVFRLKCSDRSITDHNYYANENYVRAEHAREVRAMLIHDEFANVPGSERDVRAREKLNDDFSDAVKAIDKFGRLTRAQNARDNDEFAMRAFDADRPSAQ